MSNVSFKKTDSDAILYLSGHIDSGNATQTENEISAYMSKGPVSSLTVDCSKLEYISSAGLRVLLRLRKANANMVITEVSSDVYEIFDVTGFTEMMEIRKAFRHISVDGCEIIGEGANGKVYRIDPETIVKLYRNPDSLPDIQKERELARKAFVLGIPTAIPYDVVRVGESYGSVFELLNAKSLAKLLLQQEMPVDQAVAISVDLLKKIHSTSLQSGEVPDMREVALNWVRFLKEHLPADTYAKLNTLFESVPKDNHLLHGDYHIKNVMLQDNEALLIDMDTLCMGHPVYEFGSIFNAYVGFYTLDHEESFNFFKLPHDICQRFWDQTLRLYFDGCTEEERAAIEKKAMLVGYVRLLRRTIRNDHTDTRQHKIDYAKERVIELTEQVDTLLF
ncbi:MAG: anti-sigma factor antagonist [Clostridia bacterium]|nr:anti-sigma factor antagonist [Clostridia bacterium]